MKQLVKNLIRIENSDAKINIMTAMRNKDKFDLRLEANQTSFLFIHYTSHEERAQA